MPFEKSGREPPPRTTDNGREYWGLYIAPELTCNYIVRNAAFHGHIRMLEYLFNLGFDVNFESTASARSPLATAAGAFQTAAVKWLLQHDAPVNDGWALTEAAKAGSLEIVCMLVSYGADVRVGSPLPIVSAVKIEHTAMVDYFQKHGALTPGAREEALNEARDLGLESMVELIESYS